jgi:hypothetical protein
MNHSGKSVLVTLFITLAAFFSVGYTACKKTETTPSTDLCATVVCKNSGTCFKGKCTCPGGYEGSNCETKATGRYLGNWKITEKVYWSTDSVNLNTEKTYLVSIAQDPEATVDLLINNFMGNDTYDNIGLRIGTNNKGEYTTYTTFGFKKISIPGTQMFILAGEGTINNFGTILNGRYARSFPVTTGIVRDSLSFSAERQ